MRIVVPLTSVLLVAALGAGTSCQIFTASPPCNAADDCGIDETCDSAAHTCVGRIVDAGTAGVVDAGIALPTPGRRRTVARPWMRGRRRTPGPRLDAGFVAADAGFSDAGFVAGDAGFQDAGFVIVDGGLVAADAGFPDGGFVAADAGVVDAGFVAADAGNTADAGDTADAGPDVCLDVASLALACDPADGGAACALSIDGVDGGLDGAASCVSCTATAGATVLADTPFDGPDGGCDLGGWALRPATGLQCYDAIVGTTCAISGGTRECCNDVAKLCANVGGDRMLRMDNAITGCGNNEEFRLTRSFDLTGLVDARVCWVQGATGIGDTNDGLRVFTTLPDGGPVELSCTGDQRQMTPGALTPRCVDLPVASQGQAGVNVTFVAHSDDIGDIVYLDDVKVSGTAAACAADGGTTILSATDFEACDDPLLAIDGWASVDEEVRCSEDGNWPCGAGPKRAIVDDKDGRLERTFDTVGLDDVEVCFVFGDFGGGDTGDRVEVAMDTDGIDAGQDYQRAFYVDGLIGSDDTCRPACVRLSDQDARASENPALGVRIDMYGSGGGDKISLDDLVVRARPRCPAAAQAGALAGDAQGYSFVVTGDASEDIDLVCAAGAVEAAASIELRAP